MHPSTQDPAVKVTLETLERWETELSNWGRWGPKDQRGALNLITPEKTRAAARLVEDGVTVSLGHFVTGEDAIDSQNFGPTEHWMTSIDPNTGEVRGALDAMSFSLHDGQMAHMDALCHYATQRDGKAIIFNGYPQNLTIGGCTGDLSISDMGPGYVTRGILVDMPLLLRRRLARPEHTHLRVRSRGVGGVRGNHRLERRRALHSRRPLGQA